MAAAFPDLAKQCAELVKNLTTTATAIASAPAPEAPKDDSELTKKLETLTDELDQLDEEKSSLITQLLEARRQMLSLQCRYGLVTKKAAIKELGDNKFKPPNCIFSTTQVKQIKQWIKDNDEEALTNVTASVLEPVTPGRATRARASRSMRGSADS